MDKNQILLEEIGRRLAELEKEIESKYNEVDKLESMYDELSKVVVFAHNIEDENVGKPVRGKRRDCIHIEESFCNNEDGNVGEFDCEDEGRFYDGCECPDCSSSLKLVGSNDYEDKYKCSYCGEVYYQDIEEGEYIEKLEFDECFEEDDEELNGLKKDYSEVCGSFEEFKKQFNSMINRNKVHCQDCGGEMTLDSDGEEDYYYCEKCGYECYPDENGVGFHDSNCCCDKCEPIICDCGGNMTLKFDEDGDEYYHCTQCCDIYYPDEDEDDCTPDLFRDEPVDPCDDCDDCDCDNCEFNDEDDDEEDFEDCTITCRKCYGNMFKEIEEDGDVHYECSNCGRVDYV